MSNRRTSKVKNTVLFVVIIAFLIAIIGGTYSRYISTGTANGSAGVAKWNIKVGDENLANGVFNITAIDEEANENVKANSIAPGKEMVATLEVNPSGSEVAVDYELSVGSLQSSYVDISRVKAIVDGGEEVTLSATNGMFRFFEELDDVLANKKVTFKIYVAWNDLGTAEGDAADTLNGVNTASVTVPVTITAKQVVSGEVVETGESTDLITTVANLSTGETLKLSEDLTYSDYTQYPTSGGKELSFPDNATLDLNGKTITSPNGAFNYSGDNLTIKNGNFTGLISSAGGRYGLHLWNATNGGKDVSTGVVVQNVTATGINLYNTEATLRDVTITMPDDAKFYTVYGNVYSRITIESGTYTAGNTTTALLAYCLSDSSEAGNVTADGKNPVDGFVIKGGTFITNGKPLYLKNTSHGAPVIYGGTFDCEVPSACIPEGYECVSAGEGMYRVQEVQP